MRFFCSFLILISFIFNLSAARELENVNLIVMNKINGKASILNACTMKTIQHERIILRASKIYHVCEPMPITWAFIEAWYQCPESKSLRLLISTWVNSLNHIAIHPDYDLGIEALK